MKVRKMSLMTLIGQNTFRIQLCAKLSVVYNGLTRVTCSIHTYLLLLLSIILHIPGVICSWDKQYLPLHKKAHTPRGFNYEKYWQEMSIESKISSNLSQWMKMAKQWERQKMRKLVGKRGDIRISSMQKLDDTLTNRENPEGASCEDKTTAVEVSIPSALPTPSGISNQGSLPTTTPEAVNEVEDLLISAEMWPLCWEL